MAARWKAVVPIAVAAVVGAWAWWPEESTGPSNEVTRAMTFPWGHVDDWGSHSAPAWKAVIKRYVTALNARDAGGISALIDPRGRDSNPGRAGEVVGLYSSHAGKGISVYLADYQEPGYAAFCIVYPGGATQEVIVDADVTWLPSGEGKRTGPWGLRLLANAAAEKCSVEGNGVVHSAH